MSDLISKQDAIKAVTYGALSSATLFGRSDAGMTALRETVRAIEQLPSAQQWIPVTERLPEYGTEVVTINKDDEYEINHVIDEEDGEWFFDGAVAWMPLPDPWKGE